MAEGQTLIEKDNIAESCDTTGTCEIYDGYQPNGAVDRTCVAIQCPGWREVCLFFVELASRDATLAANMADRMRWDNFGYEMILYFPSYAFEDLDIGDGDEE